MTTSTTSTRAVRLARLTAALRVSTGYDAALWAVALDLGEALADEIAADLEYVGIDAAELDALLGWRDYAAE